MIRQISTIAACFWMIIAAMGCSVNPTAVTTDPSGAFVTINNVGAGTSPLNYTFDFSKQPVYEVNASKTGYFDSSITLNNNSVGVVNNVLNLALQPDDAFSVTTTTDATNRWLRVEISSKMTQADAWQKIVDSVTDRFPSIEQMDPSSGYLRSVSVSRTFKHPQFGEHTIRTQFTGTISSRDPLVYKMMIVAQESTTAGTWVPYDRVFKEDAQMIDELQSRLGAK